MVHLVMDPGAHHVAGLGLVIGAHDSIVPIVLPLVTLLGLLPAAAQAKRPLGVARGRPPDLLHLWSKLDFNPIFTSFSTTTRRSRATAAPRRGPRAHLVGLRSTRRRGCHPLRLWWSPMAGQSSTNTPPSSWAASRGRPAARRVLPRARRREERASSTRRPAAGVVRDRHPRLLPHQGRLQLSHRDHLHPLACATCCPTPLRHWSCSSMPHTLCSRTTSCWRCATRQDRRAPHHQVRRPSLGGRIAEPSR